MIHLAFISPNFVNSICICGTGLSPVRGVVVRRNGAETSRPRVPATGPTPTRRSNRPPSCRFLGGLVLGQDNARSLCRGRSHQSLSATNERTKTDLLTHELIECNLAVSTECVENESIICLFVALDALSSPLSLEVTHTSKAIWA